jgi:hypothetical protein
MSFREITNNPRTADYPFLLIQIHLKGDKGEGKMAAFTQIRYDKKKKRDGDRELRDRARALEQHHR